MATSDRESLRTRVGISKARAAKLAGCSVPLVRLYEADPDRISAEKRPALDRAYAGFAALAVTCGTPPELRTE
jgi:hypothetical protein